MRQFTRIISVPGLTNLGVVAEGKVYRTAQPDWGPFWIGPLYIKSVLNLREQSEEIEVEGHAKKYFQLRLNILSEVTTDDFNLIVETLSAPDNQPILVHCQSGADRTGIACAAYRMAVDGWPLAEAWEELECYGGGVHDVLNLKLKHHLEHYAEAINQRR